MSGSYYLELLMNRHLMVDLETMSTSPHSAIASIGAVIFDPNADNIEDMPTFYQAVDLGSNEKAGRHFSGSTIAWWLSQTEPARAALLTDVLPLHTALTAFQLWITKNQPIICWANSPSFDCVILKDAFSDFHMNWPFNYWEERDVRTIKDAAYPNGDCPKIQLGVAHGALDDAMSQALTVQRCFSALRQAS
jgi:3' exoribonuclease, RNase T-like